MSDLGEFVEFSIVAPCKVNCEYCPQDKLARGYFKLEDKPRFMSRSTFSKCLDHMTPNKQAVSFAGFTDAALHPEFIDMFEEAWKRYFSLFLFTTFQGMSVATYNRLIEIPFALLSAHLPDAEGQMNIAWTDEYKEILTRLGTTPPKATLDCMVVKGPPHPMVEYLHPRVIAPQARANNLKLEVPETIRTSPIKCSRDESLRQNVVIPNGNAFLCCCDFGLQHYIGNLARETFESMEERRRDIIRRQRTSDPTLLCATCEHAISL